MPVVIRGEALVSVGGKESGGACKRVGGWREVRQWIDAPVVISPAVVSCATKVFGRLNRATKRVCRPDFGC